MTDLTAADRLAAKALATIWTELTRVEQHDLARAYQHLRKEQVRVWEEAAKVAENVYPMLAVNWEKRAVANHVAAALRARTAEGEKT